MEASRYGNELALMEAMSWSYGDLVQFRDEAPEAMYRELELRLIAKGRVADDHRKEQNALLKSQQSRSRRGHR